jgi:hypothetical protein
MRKAARLSLAFLIGTLGVLAGGRAVGSPLQYHGGPFLEKFEIYSLYYGIWTKSEIDTQQAFRQSRRVHVRQERTGFPAAAELIANS